MRWIFYVLGHRREKPGKGRKEGRKTFPGKVWRNRWRVEGEPGRGLVVFVGSAGVFAGSACGVWKKCLGNWEKAAGLFAESGRAKKSPHRVGDGAGLGEDGR